MAVIIRMVSFEKEMFKLSFPNCNLIEEEDSFLRLIIFFWRQWISSGNIIHIIATDASISHNCLSFLKKPCKLYDTHV